VQVSRFTTDVWSFAKSKELDAWFRWIATRNTWIQEIMLWREMNKVFFSKQNACSISFQCANLESDGRHGG